MRDVETRVAPADAPVPSGEAAVKYWPSGMYDPAWKQLTKMGTAFFALSGRFMHGIRRATPEDAESILRFWNDSGASMGATDEVRHVRRVTENPAAVLGSR